MINTDKLQLLIVQEVSRAASLYKNWYKQQSQVCRTDLS